MYRPISTEEERMGLLREAHSVASVNVASDCGCLLMENRRLVNEVARLRGEQEASMDGADLIAVERFRQIHGEGYKPEHDDSHIEGELLTAAYSYLQLVCHDHLAEQSLHGSSVNRLDTEWFRWPFEKESWKPSSDPIRNLIKAGALIAAEIDRLRRPA